MTQKRSEKARIYKTYEPFNVAKELTIFVFFEELDINVIGHNLACKSNSW